MRRLLQAPLPCRATWHRHVHGAGGFGDTRWPNRLHSGSPWLVVPDAVTRRAAAMASTLVPPAVIHQHLLPELLEQTALIRLAVRF
jgi:hypothetical protein